MPFRAIYSVQYMCIRQNDLVKFLIVGERIYVVYFYKYFIFLAAEKKADSLPRQIGMKYDINLIN